MSRIGPSRYAMIGYVVSKVVVPLAKRKVRQKARAGTVGAARGGAKVARGNTAATVGIGALLGALAWLARRSMSDDDARSGRAADAARGAADGAAGAAKSAASKAARAGGGAAKKARSAARR